MIPKNDLVYDIGINDADYYVQPRLNGVKTMCPFYVAWSGMLRRCQTGGSFQKKHPSYIGCSVVPEWHSFMAFRAWMMTQDWQGKHLDKDILIPGNKVYGPDTCAFVLPKINKLLLDRKAARGDWPIGVDYLERSNKFRTQMRINGENIHLGLFNTASEAHAAWQLAKAAIIDEVAFVQTNPRVAAALYQRADILRADWINGEETK